jgi:hypothetical protein
MAFNDNLAFDQFTIEQLAGDLLPNPTLWQRVATGYNRLLQTTHEGGAQDAEYLAIYQADRVRNFSETWLAGSMGCAQCHDHKFDPYTQEEFYSLGAFFADVDHCGSFEPVGKNTEIDVRPPEMLGMTGIKSKITAAAPERALHQADKAAAFINKYHNFTSFSVMCRPVFLKTRSFICCT